MGAAAIRAGAGNTCTVAVVDRAGNLAARVLGEVTETTLRELIGDVLAEVPGEG